MQSRARLTAVHPAGPAVGESARLAALNLIAVATASSGASSTPCSIISRISAMDGGRGDEDPPGPAIERPGGAEARPGRPRGTGPRRSAPRLLGAPTFLVTCGLAHVVVRPLGNASNASNVVLLECLQRPSSISAKVLTSPRSAIEACRAARISAIASTGPCSDCTPGTTASCRDLAEGELPIYRRSIKSDKRQTKRQDKE
jgi:hypothetical protein